MVSLTRSPLRAPGLAHTMAAHLRHRGPDCHGIHRREHLAIGCQRLRIIDPDPRADQPLVDPSGQVVAVCNGEIYNTQELRQRFPDYSFQSRSDIEVILPIYLRHGPAGLRDLDGMFALAVWDDRSGSLTLARDRAGEKPLFLRRSGGEVWFASEAQALFDDPRLSRELDPVALCQYLTLGYVREPRTLVPGIEKLAAGTIAHCSPAGIHLDPYWDPRAFSANGHGHTGGKPGRRRTSHGELRGAVERLRPLLRRAVRRQMRSDVPVGVLVSGGLDSALLATLAAEAGDGPLHTFVARFPDRSYDESDWAAQVAAHVGAEHHEVLIDEPSLGEALDAVTHQLGEPLADPAVLPTYLVAREASRHVKVLLSGEGADELFGGYPTYLGHRLAPWARALPKLTLRAARRCADCLPASHRKVTLGFLLKRFLKHVEKPWTERHLGWFGTGAQSLLADAPENGALDGDFLELPDHFTSAMLLDFCTYLRDGLLVKVDRATMLSSVEARAPYLDRRLSELVLGLPQSLKVRGTTTKWILKEAARQWLPDRLIDRRKRGLSVPVAAWINGGLRSEVDRLLDPERLARRGLVDVQEARRLLAEHRARSHDHGRALWALVILEYWLERWLPAGADPTDDGEASTAAPLTLVTSA